MFLIDAHPTRGRLLEYGRLIERGVYIIITGKKGAFIGDGRLKERGRLLEKIRYCHSLQILFFDVINSFAVSFLLTFSFQLVLYFYLLLFFSFF